MEAIQLAQMLADLKAMEASEKEASLALVSANKTINVTSAASDTDLSTAKPTSAPGMHQRSVSSHAAISPSNSQQHIPGTRLDALGRRLPASRTNSATNSIPGTPRNEAVHEDEIDRARTIMALSEIRAKLRDQDHTSLLRAREKMNALAARQQQQQQQRPSAERTKSASMFVFPRSK